MSRFTRKANRQVSANQQADSVIQHSTFHTRPTYKTTFNFGDLIPVRVQEVLPSDHIVKLDVASVVRMATPLFPVMDNAYLDFYAFFVPTRLLWDHWPQLFGENNENAWTLETEYTVPHFEPGVLRKFGSDLQFTLWDYMGLPVPSQIGEDDPATYAYPYFPAISVLKFRGYHLIHNEWFRNQNTTAPDLVDTGDAPGNIDDLIKVKKVCRMHDYFSDALPSPQKGPDTLIPGIDGAAVVTGPDNFDSYSVSQFPNLRWNVGGSVPFDSAIGVSGSGITTGRTPVSTVTFPLSGSTGTHNLNPSNLRIGSTPFNPAGYTISNLRTAFQIQKIYERDARSGSRYTEYLRAAFGTISPDARLQRPEFLGTTRVPLNISQVLQTSSTDSTSPLGQTGAYSLSNGIFHVPEHAFTEHGYLYILVAARTERTYQNGVHKSWSRLSRFQFYDPALAHISNQPILNQEIKGYSYYASPDEPNPNSGSEALEFLSSPFGYQEAWADYRHDPSFVTGAFRSTDPTSLDSWHYADDYDLYSPTLSTGWMEETDQNVARTLAVPSVTDRKEQLICDILFDMVIRRPMPIKSIPGLVDHF